MLRRILLPLDGSELAERALTLAAVLAHAQDAELVLARVVPPPVWAETESAGYSAEAYDQLYDALTEDAEQYLGALADRTRAEGGTVTTLVRRGTAAATLLDLEQDLSPNLVVMSTHGRTGLARFALGSIADLLVREGSVPVLLIRPFSPALRRITTAVVPLDGSPLAEGALPLIEALAGRPIQRVLLLRAVPTDADTASAQTYLEAIARRLSATGVQVDFQIETNAASQAIERAAAAADLIVISTHGRGGLDRLRHGSVAERATRDLGTPTLLVRARVASPEQAPLASGQAKPSGGQHATH